MVWNRQQARIQNTSAVVLVTPGIFGRRGYYSNKSPNLARRIGTRNGPHIEQFNILVPARGMVDKKTREFRRSLSAPFLPSDVKQPFYFGGNSLCYAIQWATLMGAREVLLYGFTLQSGSGYFFGAGARPTPQSGMYTLDHLKPWCEWLAKERPGFVRLAPGFHGPLYDWNLFPEGLDSPPPAAQTPKVAAPWALGGAT